MASFASCGGVKEKTEKYRVPPDSAVYCMLGKSMTEVLFNPSKVTCYTLKGKKEVAKDDYEVEPNCVRDSLVGRLGTAQIAVLQFNLLSSDENYREDSIKVRSPYMPRIEFCFEKRWKEPVHVIISPSDYSWTIFYDDKRQCHWNYANKRLLERYCKTIVGKTLK